MTKEREEREETMIEFLFCFRARRHGGHGQAGNVQAHKICGAVRVLPHLPQPQKQEGVPHREGRVREAEGARRGDRIREDVEGREQRGHG